MADFANRIKILDINEIEELYGLPKFSKEEQEFYFSIDDKEREVAYSHRWLISQMFFILQLGYFKAKKMFFVLKAEDVKEDLDFIKDKYFNQIPVIKKLKINKVTFWTHQQRILELCSYHDFDEVWKSNLQEKAKQSVRISSKPLSIFKDLLDYLEREKVVLPSYSTMQKIISKTLIEEKERLCAVAQKHITNDIDRTLEELFSREENIYLLTLVKKEPKSFKYKQIQQEINKQKLLKPLYIFAKDFLPHLDISNDNIKYYASLVDYYNIFRLRRFRKAITKIYVVCFIYHRYQSITDNLVNAFIYQVRKYSELAKAAAKDAIYALKIESNQQMKSAGKILNFFIDDTIADETTFGEVKERAFEILEKEKFPQLVQYISKAEFDEVEYEWKEIESLAKKFKKSLRPIFSALDIESKFSKDPLMEVIAFLKLNILKKKGLRTIKPEKFPLSFISRKTRSYIFKRKKIKVEGSSRQVLEIYLNRYEFLVYWLIWQSIDSNDVYVPHSNEFRSFEDDLIDEEKWANKDKLLEQLGLPFLTNPIEQTLSELNSKLEFLLVEVNQRIKDGTNQGIKIITSEQEVRWTLPYKKEKDTANDPLFDCLPQIEITDLLAFVNSQCEFMDVLTHILGRYVKSNDDEEAIAASIIALATNKGIYKMAESCNLTYQTLLSATKNHLRVETIKQANDKISNSTYQLPIFQYFNVEQDLVHSSSDGQKFETQISTINARHSPKYFGLNKGVVSYTMVANNVPVNAKIIGANQHESHSVYDIISNNTSDIQPSRHSVDTHGTNNVNFLILHAFGYEFAPRYKDIHSKSETIYGFNNPKYYKDMFLKPTKKANKLLVVNEWPNVQKILVSLGLKTTTQSVIVRKLSSYTRKNRTKKAMWELDNILRSIYLLKYIDDLLLRQAVQKVLNRGEAYHQLRRAIFHEYSGKFRVDSAEEQQLWSECSRLVANAIIFYNSFLLSELLTQMEKDNLPHLVEKIKTISPIAWRHINLSGRFEFITKKKSLNIG